MSDNFLMLLSDEEIFQIENKLGYTFKNKRLLSKAFTHSSYVNENKNAVSNERLEFLGDRILNFIEAQNLFYNETGDVGQLTERLINKVSRTPLAESINALGILRYLKTSSGVSINDFENKAVSDLYEAIIAAIYIDSADLSVCASFIERTIKEAVKPDYISLLKEYEEKTKIFYKREIGDANNGSFVCSISIEGCKFEGKGRKKKDAERNCAKKVCEFLKIF